MAENPKGRGLPENLPGFDFSYGEYKIVGGVVGEKENYNLQPDVTEYELWAASTIEWDISENKFKARVILAHKTESHHVVINSWHHDFADAERAIDLVRDSLLGVGDRKIYNVFGETIEVHTSPRPGGTSVQIIEVRGLIWSMFAPTC